MTSISGTATRSTTGGDSFDQGIDDGRAPESFTLDSDGHTHHSPGENETVTHTETNVTLVTGQTVTIVECEDHTRYRTDAATPMERVTTPRGTYVYPRNVDFSTFDRDLFNVDLLRQQNLTDAESTAIPVIVDQRASETAPQRGPPTHVLDDLPGGEHRLTLSSIGSTAGRMEKSRAGDAARQLASDPGVQTVYLDAEMELALDDAGESVDAPNARRTYNVTGEGVTVAVIDSGVDNDHPDIQGSVVLEKNFNTDGDGGTDDDNGHGTHVAGIITGDGTASDGKYVGIAPEADVIDARVFPESGGASTSEIISAMEYSVDNGADVLSMSLGGPVYNERENSPYYDAVQYAVDHDVSVVVAAGNSGPDYETVLRPGIMGDVITVGASDGSGGLASFSSRGPTPKGGYVKPDVVAPGVWVTSTEAGTDGYTTMSGTSMATPVVSGTVALLRQEHPDWSEQRVKNVVTATSDSLGQQSVYAQGSGRVNATAALGSDLSVDAATIDFGSIDGDQQVTKVVRVHNLGDATRTVDVSARAEALDSGDVADVTVNRTTVTVDPGSSAAVELRIDPDRSSYGTYSGRLSVDETHTAIFGFDSSSTVRVEKTALDGNSSGDRVTLVNHDTGTQYGPFDLDGGVAELPVQRGGNYTAVSSGVNDGGAQPVLTANTTTVSGTTTIVLDESATVERGIDTTAIPEDEGDLANLTVAAGATIDGTGAALDTQVADAPTATARVSPNAKVNYTLSRILAVQPGDSALDTGTIYHLKQDLTDVTGPGDHAIDTTQLGEIHAQYYRDEPDSGYSATLGRDAPRYSDVQASGELATRHVQTIYASPGIDQSLDAAEGHGNWSAVDQDGTVAVDSSTGRTVTVARHPFQATVQEWNLTADSLSWTVSPQVGQGTNPYAMADDSAGNVTLWLDGTRQFSEERPLARHETGDATAQSIDTARLRIEDANDYSHLSDRSVTTIAARNGDLDTRPPVVPRVTFAEQDASNLVPNGTVTMTVAASDDAALADVTAYVSETDVRQTPFEDGSGWREVTLTDNGDGSYTATLDESGYRGTLSVAVNATDAAGNYVETTTYDGVVVGSRVPVASATTDRSTAEINVTDVKFDASGTSDDAAIAEYAWDFEGDGTVDATTDLPAARHTYDAFGTVTPELTVTDVHGFSNTTALEPITVQDTTAPVARVTAQDRSPGVNESVTFDAGSSTDNNAVASYDWRADGATSLKQAGSGMTATFDSPGEQEVRLTVADANETTDTGTTSVYVGNRRPTADVDDVTVDEGETVSLDASGSSDPENHTLRYAWTHVSGPSASLSETTGASTSLTAPDVDEERTIELDVSVTDEFGRSDVARVAVTVRPPDDGVDSDDGSGGGGAGGSTGGSGGGGGVGGGFDSADAPPSTGNHPTPEVDVTALPGSAGGSRVTVRNATEGEQITVGLPDEGDTRFTALHVTPGGSDDFAFDVTEGDSAPEGTTDLNASTGYRSIGFVRIDHGPVDLASVAYTFRVSRERLVEIGADPDGVALFRYEDGEWVEKETRLDGESETALTYVGTSDGFSKYAIGAAPATETETATTTSAGTVTAAPEPVGTDSETTESAATPDGNVVTQTRSSDARATARKVGAETPVVPVGIVVGTVIAGLAVVLARRR